MKSILWRQFSAAIDSLDAALTTCPDDLWTASMWKDPAMQTGLSEFWYVAYHALFWLDLYLSGSVEGFAPPEPFTLSELDPKGLLPNRRYARDELRNYLSQSRLKCETVIESLNDEIASNLCAFNWGSMPFAELLLDNMRHVQEHSAQLHMFLGQQKGLDNRWFAKGNNK